MSEIRVALLGVGNCASSLVQGIQKYKDVGPDDKVNGLMYPVMDNYSVGDINVVAAFDVNDSKVGLVLSEAIFASPNNAIKFQDVPPMGVKVERGMTHDGIGKYLSSVIKKAPGKTSNVTKILQDLGVDVVVNYLPVGSESATKWYVEQLIAAGCGFVNCIPVFIASSGEGYWQKRFEDAELPVIGDDIKSQVGATIVHRVLTRLFVERGVELNKSYQLNFGGNSDFLNMLEQERLVSKKISKTESVRSQVDRVLSDENVHIGPSDHVPWLEDSKWCYIRMEGKGFADIPINVELKLEVSDSPNSAGVVVDAIRCCKIALDRKMKGPIVAPSSYYMKSPPRQFTDDNARRNLETFVNGGDTLESDL